MVNTHSRMSLGGWSNAPLAYVSASIRVSRPVDLSQHGTKIREAFSREWPFNDVKTTLSVDLPGTVPATSMHHEYLDAQQGSCLRIAHNGIEVQTVNYVGSADFRERMFAQLDRLRSLCEVGDVVLMQILMVDLLLPEGEQSATSSLVPVLQPWAWNPPDEASFNRQSTLFNSAFDNPDDGQSLRLFVQSGIPIRSQPLLPQLGNFTPAPIHLSPPQKKALALAASAPDARIAFLVTQTAWTPIAGRVNPISPESAKNTFAALQRNATSAFLQATTSEAQKTWQT